MMGNICKTTSVATDVEEKTKLVHSIAPVSQYMERENPDEVILDLEQKGYVEAAKVLPNILSNNKTVVESAGEKLIGFMTAGADDFEKRTGRKMTYAEMRAAWG